MHIEDIDEATIRGIGERLAILKMESVCTSANGDFQRGFQMGFEEAFNLIRSIGRSDYLLERRDRSKRKQNTDMLNEARIATSVGSNKENNTMCNLNEVKKRVEDSDLEPFKKAIRTQHPDWPEHLVVDVAEMDRETLLQCIELSKKRDEFPQATTEAPANQKFRIAKSTKEWFKDLRSIDVEICTDLKAIGFDTDDFVEFIGYMYQRFGYRKQYEADDLKSINDIGELLIYVNEHVAEPK